MCSWLLDAWEKADADGLSRLAAPCPLALASRYVYKASYGFDERTGERSGLDVPLIVKVKPYLKFSAEGYAYAELAKELVALFVNFPNALLPSARGVLEMDPC
eukprot:508408-Alexandrium_andersonii.AAC.1